MPTYSDLKDLLTRTLLTFVQVFLATLVVTGPIDQLPSLAAGAAIAGAAAVLSLVKTYIGAMLGTLEDAGTWQDLVWRVLWTFLFAFLSALPTNLAGLTNLGTWQIALIAGVAAVSAAVKTFIGNALEAASFRPVTVHTTSTPVVGTLPGTAAGGQSTTLNP